MNKNCQHYANDARIQIQKERNTPLFSDLMKDLKDKKFIWGRYRNRIDYI